MRVYLLVKLNLLESIRRQLHLMTLFLCFGELLLPSYINAFSMGTNAFERVAKDFGLTMVSYFGLALSLYMGASSIPADIERKTLHPLLARPLPRIQYILAKYLSVIIQLAVSIFLLTTCLGLSLGVLSKVFDPRLFEAALGYWMECSVLTAVTMLVSIFASPALAGVAGLFIYLTGGLTDTFISFFLMQDRESTSATFVANACKAVFPHFEVFRIKDAVVHNLPISPDYLAAACFYGLSWIVLCLVLADYGFHRKDL